MLNPDLHITIYVSAEVVRLLCATVGFAIAMWTMIKGLQLLKSSKSV